MPERTEIEVSKAWLEHEEQLMRRIAVVINGPPQIPEDIKEGPPFKKSHEYSHAWQLDRANDYFGDIQDGKLVLTARYGGERFRALVEFCKVWLKEER